MIRRAYGEWAVMVAMRSFSGCEVYSMPETRSRSQLMNSCRSALSMVCSFATSTLPAIVMALCSASLTSSAALKLPLDSVICVYAPR